MQACFCLHKRFLIRFGIGRTPEALGKVINMLKILYEDEQILVVWKPAGTESQESRGFGRDMVSEIRKHIHSQFPEKGIPYVGVIHRLDKPVSGLLVYAKTQKAAAALSKQTVERRMKKKYLAVLCGKPVDNVDNFVDYLLKRGRENRSCIVDKGITGAKRAELSFRILESQVLEPYGELSLAEITLQTGRHHQIRVQMAGHGLPLWGDQKYNTASSYGWNLPATSASDSVHLSAASAENGIHLPASNAGLALSAWHLAFTHPVTEKQMVFEKLPEEGIFQRFGYCINIEVQAFQ